MPDLDEEALKSLSRASNHRCFHRPFGSFSSTSILRPILTSEFRQRELHVRFIVDASLVTFLCSVESYIDHGCLNFKCNHALLCHWSVPIIARRHESP